MKVIMVRRAAETLDAHPLRGQVTLVAKEHNLYVITSRLPHTARAINAHRAQSFHPLLHVLKTFPVRHIVHGTHALPQHNDATPQLRSEDSMTSLKQSRTGEPRKYDLDNE